MRAALALLAYSCCSYVFAEAQAGLSRTMHCRIFAAAAITACAAV
jgi:hypothetical protein